MAFIPNSIFPIRQTRRTNIYVLHENHDLQFIATRVAIKVPRAAPHDHHANDILNRIYSFTSRIQYAGAPIVPLFVTDVVIEGIRFRGVASRWFDNGNVLEFVRSNPGADHLRLTRDLASAICFLHRQGIIIGNLHPGNVMVRGNGGAMLMDTGMAYFHDEFPGGNVARPHDSWPYKPAEELLGNPRTQAMDIYSFGTTSHAIHTGLDPIPVGWRFSRWTVWIVRNGHGHLVIPHGMRRRVWRVLQQCMEHHDPTLRPAMTTVVDILDRIQT